MARLFALLMAAGLLAALPAAGQLPPRPPAEGPTESELREEDESLSRPAEYVFNPIQAAEELKVGDFYWKKGSHNAAALRYLEATRWNPDLADAWLKLGEAREKLKEYVEAREAYERYLEVEPGSRKAPSLRKKIDRWSKLKPKS